MFEVKILLYVLITLLILLVISLLKFIIPIKNKTKNLLNNINFFNKNEDYIITVDDYNNSDFSFYLDKNVKSKLITASIDSKKIKIICEKYEYISPGYFFYQNGCQINYKLELKIKQLLRKRDYNNHAKNILLKNIE